MGESPAHNWSQIITVGVAVLALVMLGLLMHNSKFDLIKKDLVVPVHEIDFGTGKKQILVYDNAIVDLSKLTNGAYVPNCKAVQMDVFANGYKQINMKIKLYEIREDSNGGEKKKEDR